MANCPLFYTKSRASNISLPKRLNYRASAIKNAILGMSFYNIDYFYFYSHIKTRNYLYNVASTELNMAKLIKTAFV